MSNIERTKLYNGDVILKFDKENHSYSAIVDGEEKDPIGVTTITGVIDKSTPIKYWALNCMEDYLEPKLINAIDDDHDFELDEVSIKEILREGKNAHKSDRDSAADIGTIAHEWIEDYINAKIDGEDTPSKPSNENVLDAVEAFLAWEEQHEIEYLFSEKRVYSKKYNYAGTADFGAKIDGKLFVGDIKTSKSIYPSHILQTAAYQQALSEEEEKYKDADRVLVKIGKDGSGFEVKELEEFEKDKQGFVGALRLKRRLIDID